MWLRWMGNVRNLVNACALGEQGCAVRNLDTPHFLVRPAKYRPAWRAPRWFAAITTTTLAPPHSRASPTVPAHVGSGSPPRPLQERCRSRFRKWAGTFLKYRTKKVQIFYLHHYRGRTCKHAADPLRSHRRGGCAGQSRPQWVEEVTADGRVFSNPTSVKIIRTRTCNGAILATN